MVRINKNLVLALFVLVILIVGCRPPTSSSTGEGSIYRKGTGGLVINFLSGAPPSKMFVDSPYTVEIPISIEVWNKGAYPGLTEDEGRMQLWKTDKDDDVIFISGFDHNLITDWNVDGNSAELIGGKYPYVLLEDKVEVLEGKNINNPEGGYDLLEFIGALDLGSIYIDKYNPSFLVTACYDYKTKAEPNVCIDPRPFSAVNERKACEIKDISLTNQGAPVAITKVEVQALSNSMQFRIHFKNVGKGSVIATDVLKRCSGKDGKGNLKKSDMDLVKVIKVEVGDMPLECGKPVSVRGYEGQQHKGYARLVNGQGFVVCNLDNYKDDVDSAYTTPLYVELAYGYKETILKTVEIIKVPEPK